MCGLPDKIVFTSIYTAFAVLYLSGIKRCFLRSSQKIRVPKRLLGPPKAWVPLGAHDTLELDEEALNSAVSDPGLQATARALDRATKGETFRGAYRSISQSAIEGV